MMKNAVDHAATSAAPAKRSPPKLETRITGDAEALSELSGDMSRILAATGKGALAEEFLRQLAAMGSQGSKIDNGATNFALGLVDAMEPRDAVEVLLVGQMAVIHQATMMMARRLNHVETLPQQDSAERALNKLARTFAAQMDTLKRYRSKGEQTVRVERVTVESGAQAVVGNVSKGGA